jgi:hypothetical protein
MGTEWDGLCFMGTYLYVLVRAERWYMRWFALTWSLYSVVVVVVVVVVAKKKCRTKMDFATA